MRIRPILFISTLILGAATAHAQTTDRQLEEFMDEIAKDPPAVAAPAAPPATPPPATAPPARWGALAGVVWRHRGVVQVAVGSAIRFESKSAAVAEALRQCRRQARRRCKIATTWNIGCGYIITGRNRRGAGWVVGKTRAAAQKRCRAKGYRCKRPIGGCVNQ